MNWLFFVFHLCRDKPMLLIMALRNGHSPLRLRFLSFGEAGVKNERDGVECNDGRNCFYRSGGRAAR